MPGACGAALGDGHGLIAGPGGGLRRAGPGVTGRLGIISRPGGGVQATYGGHPLYSYIGDNSPGQANGNNLDLNGGLWYEARTAG